MQKLLTLDGKSWTTGIAFSSMLQNAGIFAKARGINPFVNPYNENSQIGIFQAGAHPIIHRSSGMGASDIIWAGASRVTGSNAGNLYLYASSGAMFDKDLSGDSVPTDMRTSTTVTTPANGMEIFQSTDGSKYMYYMRTTAIGRWDFDGPTSGFVDDWDTGLTSTTHHPTHIFKGAVYFGNYNNIGKIYSISGSGASTATTGAGTLTLPADFLTTCLEDDGDYLIAGITKNTSEATNLTADTRVIFWDTVSQNFNKEWIIPDSAIHGVKRFSDGFLALCNRGLYYFNLVTKPKRIRILGSNAMRFGYPNAVDVFGDAVLWGSTTSSPNYLSSYGKFIPEAQNAYMQPFSELGEGSPTYVNSSVKTGRIYVGTASPNFFYYDVTSSGGTLTANPETIYMDLKTEMKIEMFDLFFAEPLASGDSLTITVQTDEDTSAVSWGTVAYDASQTTRRARLQKDGGLITDKFKMIFAFTTGGNVKIKQIDVYGEPEFRI